MGCGIHLPTFLRFSKNGIILISIYGYIHAKDAQLSDSEGVTEGGLQKVPMRAAKKAAMFLFGGVANLGSPLRAQ